MTANIALEYYVRHLLDIYYGPKCCMEFRASFRPNERLTFAAYANYLGLFFVPYIVNGVEALKIFKQDCTHYIRDSFNMQLQPNSLKDLFFLYSHRDFIDSQHEMQASPNFFGSGHSQPSVPPHRFSLGPLKQSMVRQNWNGSFQHKSPINVCKVSLLAAVQRNRVLIVNCAASFESSTAIPMIIIENCAKIKAHCKIMCVEPVQLLAIYNSQRLADQIREKVGNTVAFRVHFQSCISEFSNLIYTTASYFLRVLMGQNINDSFRHMSHVIVGDIHRHDAYTDILLCELREALKFHPDLRLILLSNSDENVPFIDYFGEGEELKLTASYSSAPLYEQPSPQIFYLEDILHFIDNERRLRPQTLSNASQPPNFANNGQLDRYLEEYNTAGSDDVFNHFLCMVQADLAPINYRHSVYGCTALILAAKLGKAEHIRRLLQLYADPFVMDNNNLNAIGAANVGRNAECMNLLNLSHENTRLAKLKHPSFIDVDLLTDLIRLILARCHATLGNYNMKLTIYTIRSSYCSLNGVCFPLRKFAIINFGS